MALYRDLQFNKGTVTDLMGATGTITSTTFNKDKKGWALQTGSGKYVQYDKQLLPNNAFSIVVWGYPKESCILGTDRASVIGDNSSSIPAIMLMYNNAQGNAIIALASNNYRFFNTPRIRKISCYIFTITGNSINDIDNSKLFVNNVEISAVNPIKLGNQVSRSGFVYVGGASTPNGGSNISRIKVYDHVLTTKEREREQIEFEAAQPLTYQKRLLQLPKPTELKQQGLIAAYNMKSVGNILHDISGNGNHGTTTGCLKLVNGIRFNGISDRISKGAISDISTTKKFTICVRLKPNNITNGQQIVVNGNSGTDRCGVVITTNTIGIETYNGTYKAINGTITNKTINTFIGICNENTLSAYLNGVLLSGTITTGNLGNTLSGFAIGSSSGSSNFYNGEIYDIRIYNRVLTSQEIKAYHNSFNEVILQESFNDMAVSNSKLPSGWIKNGGSFICGESTTNDTVIKSIRKGTKYLRCVTAGIVAIPCKQARGTWEWDWYKGGDGTVPIFYFMSTKIDTYLTNNSYLFYANSNESLLLQRAVSGALTSLAVTSLSYIQIATWYRIRITISTSGVFTLWILGGNFTNWTLVSTTGGSGTNPVTDNTYTTSNYFVMDLDANDRVGNILIQSQIKQ